MKIEKRVINKKPSLLSSKGLKNRWEYTVEYPTLERLLFPFISTRFWRVLNIAGYYR